MTDIPEITEEERERGDQYIRDHWVPGTGSDSAANRYNLAEAHADGLAANRVQLELLRAENEALTAIVKRGQLAEQSWEDQGERVRELEGTLNFYADPETYFAVGFFPDPPNGEFMDDFGATELGFKPGERARRVLATSGNRT